MKSLVLICRRPTWDIAAGTAWDNCDICEHLSPTHLSVPGIHHCLACEVELSSTLQASRQLMFGTDYVLAINGHICRSIVPGLAGGHIPGRSAAYEKKAKVCKHGCDILDSREVLRIIYLSKRALFRHLHSLI